MKKTNKYERLLQSVVRCWYKKQSITIDVYDRAHINAGDNRTTPEEEFAILIAKERSGVYPEYFITVLGDALARRKEWALSGQDAVEYAIISEYSWSLSEVRQLSPRDKWLVLYEHWCQVELDPLAQDAWMSKYKVPLTEDGSAHWRDQV